MAFEEVNVTGTLAAIETVLAAGGHDVVCLEADARLPSTLAAAGVDVVFNIAERITGAAPSASREALVPALCEVLGLPYNGSGVLATALFLDKPRTKHVLAAHSLPTPAFRVFEQPDEALSPALSLPLIVKLACEGSSMAMADDSIVDDEAALRRRIGWVLERYPGPLLVEEFLAGREFTIGILGNATLEVLPVVELVFERARGINLASRLRDTARRAFRALDCRDWCRTDLRLAADGSAHVLELNPIAGIDPSYLLPRAAAAVGYSYAALVNRILDLAIERAGVPRAFPGAAPLRRMRIAHIQPWVGLGGAEIAALRLASAARRAGHEDVFFFPASSGPAIELVRASGFETSTYVAAEPRKRRPLPFALASIRLAQELRRRGIDVVHCVDALGARSGALAGRLAGGFVIAHIVQAQNWLSRLDRVLLYPVQRYVFVAQSVWDSFAVTVPRAKGEVLYEGYSAEPASPELTRDAARIRFGLPAGAFVFGMAARVAPQKDYDSLIRAAAIVQRRLPRCRFLVAGDYRAEPQHRTHHESLLSLLRKTGTEGIFVFGGMQSEMQTLGAIPKSGRNGST